MYSFSGVIDRVVDGDTVVVSVNVGFRIKHTINLRIQGIDTPELRRVACDGEKEFGAYVKLALIGVAQHRDCILKSFKGKSFDRWVADISYYDQHGRLISVADFIRENKLEKKDMDCRKCVHFKGCTKIDEVYESNNLYWRDEK